jgi:hypothetical protein
MIDKTELGKLVPLGGYCYSYTGRIAISNKLITHEGKPRTTSHYYFIPETIPCPFWNQVNDDGLAYCSYMEKTSKWGEMDNLLWDQIKECEVNEGDYETLFEMEEFIPNSPHKSGAWKRANERADKKPDFIMSLIYILADTDNNEFTYDGVTYTLHHSLYQELSQNT